MQEIDPDGIEDQVEDDSNAIEIRKATFAWGESKQLHDINISIKEGSITAIVGQVGSGKSSLLQVQKPFSEKCSYCKGEPVLNAQPNIINTSWI